MSFDHDRFKNVAAGVQSSIVAAGVLIGGIWTIVLFVGFSGASRAVADAQKAQAEATLVQLTLANEAIVDCVLTVKQLSRSGASRWLAVELAIKNSGTKPLTVATDRNMKFYLRRIESIDQTGQVVYSSRAEQRDLQFDYPDRQIERLILRPKGDYERIQAIQHVENAGLYLARFSSRVPGTASGAGTEYGAESFFVVK